VYKDGYRDPIMYIDKTEIDKIERKKENTFIWTLNVWNILRTEVTLDVHSWAIINGCLSLGWFRWRHGVQGMIFFVCTRYSMQPLMRLICLHRLVLILAMEVYKNNTSYYSPLVRMSRSYNELVRSSKDIDIFDSNFSRFNKVITTFFKEQLI
jgi:hypothetical protein